MILNIKRLLKSFHYAFKGAHEVLEREQNLPIQIIFACAVIILAFVLELGRIEICILFLAIALVLCVETINTALEIYIDRIVHRDDEKIGLVKDILAAATFFSVIIAMLIGAILFFQPVLNLFLKLTL